MKFEPIHIKDKAGRNIILRSPEPSDAAALIDYLKETAAETPYLIREPEEVTLTLEQEIAFIEKNLHAEREGMLLASLNGKLIGNCSLMNIGPFKRYSHRCGVAIALYREYCGFGIGSQMMAALLDIARKCGYEQAELEVISTNQNAIALYRKLGFESYGTFPCNMKYSDSTYADAVWMMKKL